MNPDQLNQHMTDLIPRLQKLNGELCKYLDRNVVSMDALRSRMLAQPLTFILPLDVLDLIIGSRAGVYRLLAKHAVSPMELYGRSFVTLQDVIRITGLDVLELAGIEYQEEEEVLWQK